MEDRADFAAYALARWVGLVRAGVVLGLPTADAEEAAREALARLSVDWKRRDTWGDLEERTLDAFFEVVRTGPGARGARGAAAEGVVLGPELERRLDLLRPAERQALARRAVLEPERTGEDLRPVLADVDPTGLTVDEVLDRARRERRRRLRLLGVASGLVVVAAAAATLVANGPGEPEEPALGPLEVTPAANPAPVTWFADGGLHLGDVELALPSATDVSAISGGVVYGAGDGAVVLLDEDGTRTRIGTKEPTTPAAASDSDGLAAWVDPSGDRPELVLFDLAARRTTQRVAIVPGEDLRVVAIDGGGVYYVDGDGAHEFDGASGVVSDVAEPGVLVDVASGVRVLQISADRLEVVQPLFQIDLRLAGAGGTLSPDGNLLLTRIADGTSAFGSVRIYDTRSGAVVDSGLGSDDVAVAATLARRGQVVYAVGRAVDRPEVGDFLRLSETATLELRTCLLEGYLDSFSEFPDDASCRVDAAFPSFETFPVLSVVD